MTNGVGRASSLASGVLALVAFAIGALFGVLLSAPTGDTPPTATVPDQLLRTLEDLSRDVASLDRRLADLALDRKLAPADVAPAPTPLEPDSTPKMEQLAALVDELRVLVQSSGPAVVPEGVRIAKRTDEVAAAVATALAEPDAALAQHFALSPAQVYLRYGLPDTTRHSDWGVHWTYDSEVGSLDLLFRDGLINRLWVR